jgi:hypothetical protein
MTISQSVGQLVGFEFVFAACRETCKQVSYLVEHHLGFERPRCCEASKEKALTAIAEGVKGRLVPFGRCLRNIHQTGSSPVATA